MHIIVQLRTITDHFGQFLWASGPQKKAIQGLKASTKAFQNLGRNTIGSQWNFNQILNISALEFKTILKTTASIYLNSQYI